MYLLHSEVTNYQILVKFGPKFDLVGTQKGQLGLVFRCKLLEGTENFLSQPGLEPRLLDYQSSVLTIIPQSVLCIATIYCIILMLAC